MTGCPFCDRINAIPMMYEIWQRDVVSFEPLNPVTPGHLLVVPINHVTDAASAPAIASDVMFVAAQIVRIRGEHANIITSIGADATQTVRHLHVHVVPRRPGDGLHLPWTGQQR